MRKSKEIEECDICTRQEHLWLVNLHYGKHRVCDTCLKWFTTLLYNTVHRFKCVLAGEHL